MEKCVPLEITNIFSRRYNSPWDDLENFHKLNGTDIHWNKKCYVPSGAILSMLESKGVPEERAIIDTFALAAVTPWRIYKQIYTFDIEMEKLLDEQGSLNLIVPTEVLYNMPYPCIYIKTNTKKYIDGFFVFFQAVPYELQPEGTLELHFLIIKDNDNLRFTPLSIVLDNKKTLGECVKKYLKSVQQRSDEDYSEVSSALFKEASEVLPFFMQLVLYICAENREIEEDKVQKKITKKPSSSKFIKDKFREVQKWNLGTRTGIILRAFKAREKTYSNSENKEQEATLKVSQARGMMVPHSRRGHWHHFWIGKRGTDSRKLILKWVAPTFIHKNFKNDYVTNNIIEKPQKST